RDELSDRLVDATVSRTRRTGVFLVQVAHTLSESLRRLLRAVCRAVVNHDDFDSAAFLRKNRFDGLRQVALAIEYGDDTAQQRNVGHGPVTSSTALGGALFCEFMRETIEDCGPKGETS